MYDYVIVGAGSAGCALAARLSEDGRHKVLVLEAGEQDRAKEIRIPAAFPKLFHTRHDWDYRTEPEPSTANRARYWPRGRMLGGSSSMNAMMYVRGHAADFDRWRDLGNAGWGYEDVLAYFKRGERFLGPDPDRRFHGTEGPLIVGPQCSPSQLAYAFIEAGKQVGLAHNDDVNGAAQHGIGLAHVNQRNGRRWSAADAFLKPATGRGNLTVEVGCLVHRIEWVGRRATGVVYSQGGVERTADAAREVILCAGSIGSPQILMLSGVGPGGALSRHGIGVVQDAPGVGRNLQDHLMLALTHRCLRPVTLAGAESLPSLARYLILGRGPLTSNVGEALAFLQTRDGLSAPDVELILAPTFFMEHGAANPPGHGFTIGVVLLRPESRGSIGIQSADPRVPPAIRPGYLTAKADLATLRAGLRFARRLAAAPAFSPYRGEEVWPGAGLRSDDDLDAFIRLRSETLYHPVGTCRMGSDADAVVDDRLRVRGVQGLRVADASVMPVIIGGHPNAAAIMIGEKAADLLAGDRAG